MYRDFSDKSKNELLGLVSEVENEKISNFTDWVGDRWYDFESWIGKLNIKNYLNNVNDYHKKVIDKNNATKSTINDIFTRVNALDNTYGGIFLSYKSQSQQIQRYIQELSHIVNPGNGRFSVSTITSNLAQLLEELTFDDLMVPPDHVDINAKIITGSDPTAAFISTRKKWLDATAIVWNSDWIKNFLSVLDFSDNLEGDQQELLEFANILDVENSSELAVRKSIEELIKNTIENRHETTDFWDSYADALTPQEFKWLEEICDLVVSQGKLLTKHEMAEFLGIDERDITESKYLNFLMDKADYEFFEALSTGLDNTIGAYTDAAETLDVATQMIGYLLNDYSEDLKYLESLKIALLDAGYEQSIVNNVIDDIIYRYENNIKAAIEVGIDNVFETCVNGIVSKCSLLNALLGAKDFGCLVSGLGDQVENLEIIYTTYQYSGALVEKYNYYADKIRSGIYTADDVKQCEVYFDLARNAKIQEYKAIVKLYKDAIESVDLDFTSGVDDVIAALITSENDIQATRDLIVRYENEIKRLEEM